MDHFALLETLLRDALANVELARPHRTAQYLSALSDLAGALSRQHWAEFEVHACREMRQKADSPELKQLLQIKRGIAEKELMLAQKELVRLHDWVTWVTGARQTRSEQRARAALVEDLKKQGRVIELRQKKRSPRQPGLEFKRVANKG